jgi:hypothetical protein
MFIITIRIHADGKQDDEIDEDSGKPAQGLELEPEVERVYETKAQNPVRRRTLRYLFANLLDFGVAVAGDIRHIGLRRDPLHTSLQCV